MLSYIDSNQQRSIIQTQNYNKMENQTNTSKVLISRDSNKILRITADLENHQSILNNVFKRIENRFGIVASTEHIKDICIDKAVLLKQQISDAYDKEAKKYLFPHAKQNFLDGKEEAFNEVDSIVREVEAQQDSPKIGCGYSSAWAKLQYLACNDGVVEVLKDKVIEDNSYYAAGALANQFKERAKALFEEMKNFDRYVRLLSDNQVMGLYDATPGYDAIITCADGRLWLDFNHMKWMDFDNVEVLLNSEPSFHIEENVICKVEEL